MNIFISGIALIPTVIDWVAVANKWKKLEYFAKPGVILALISWLIVNGGYRGQLQFFLIGLIFSLAGDIFLLLPNEYFLAGLISFLHSSHSIYPGILYSFSNISAAGLILIIFVELIAFAMFNQISNGLKAQVQMILRIPILIYSFVIALILISTLLTMIGPNSEWNSFPSL